jgi:hypothetical protein
MKQRESLDTIIERKFRGVTTTALVERIHRAADFKSDDEEHELTRRLQCESREWRYGARDHIEIYDIEPCAIVASCEHSDREDRNIYVAGQVTETVTACESCADRYAQATAAYIRRAAEEVLRDQIKEGGGSFQAGNKIFQIDEKTDEIFHTYAAA